MSIIEPTHSNGKKNCTYCQLLFRIKYKISLLVFKCLLCKALYYLKKLINVKVPRYSNYELKPKEQLKEHVPCAFSFFHQPPDINCPQTWGVWGMQKHWKETEITLLYTSVELVFSKYYVLMYHTMSQCVIIMMIQNFSVIFLQIFFALQYITNYIIVLHWTVVKTFFMLLILSWCHIIAYFRFITLIWSIFIASCLVSATTIQVVR